MKRSIKCFGLLSVLFTIFGLSLNVYSDTSALQYKIKSVPYWSPAFVDYNNDEWFLTEGLSVDFASQDAPSDFDLPHPKGWYNFYNSSSNKCLYDSSFSTYSTGSGMAFNSWGMFFNTNGSGQSVCQRFGADSDQFPGFGNDGIPQFLNSSIPNVGDPWFYNFSSFLPKFYNYTNFGISFTETPGGYTENITDKDLFGTVVNKPNEMSIPLALDFSKVSGEHTAGRDLSYSGRFTFFGNNNSPWNPTENAGRFRVSLDYAYEDEDYGLSYDRVVSNCSTSYATGTDNSAPLIFFTCHVSPRYDIYENYVGATLSFGNGTGYIFDAGYTGTEGSAWGLSFMTLTTDNDTTPSDQDISFTPDGVDQNNAPGFPGYYESHTPYFSSLINLFNFSFVNPFSGLFGLFTDSSRCVDIPTIAGMLGSDETQYCPWFDDTVRNILTPVLGIAANMLLFGFAVRWLGSSSGNNFEDTNVKESK